MGRDRKSFGGGEEEDGERRRIEELVPGRREEGEDERRTPLLLCRGTISSAWFAVYLYSTYRRKKKAEDGRSAKVNTGVDGPSLPLLRSMETGEN